MFSVEKFDKNEGVCMKEIIKGAYLYDYDKIRFACHISTKLQDNEKVWAQPYPTNYFSLVYIKSGTVMAYRENSNFLLKKNDCVIFDLSENVPMFTHNNDTACLYTLDFQPELFGKIRYDINNFNDMFRYILNISPDQELPFPENNIFHDKNDRILNMFEIIEKEYSEREPMYIDIISSNVKAVLIEFARNMKVLKDVNSYSDIVQKLIDHCILHYNEDITLKELSETFHYSQTHITNLFRESVGYSFLEYLRQFRIYKAGIMLYRTNHTVSEIAKSVGYKKTEYFSKLFKDHVGVTPLQYRKNIREINHWYPELKLEKASK